MPTTPIPLRWADVDSYGHVNNVVFVRYLEEARFAVFTPEVFDLFPEGSNGLMASHRIEYRAPLSWRTTPISARLWITRVGTSSFEIGYELGEADDEDAGSTVYAIASTVLVVVDTASGRPVALPDALRVLLTSWLDAPVPFRA